MRCKITFVAGGLGLTGGLTGAGAAKEPVARRW